MPLHNLIQGRRFDSVIRRLFAIKQANAVPTVEPSLMGTVEVQDFEPEMYFLREEKLGVITLPVGAGGALIFSNANIFNGEAGELPPGKLLTIVERVTILGDQDAQTFQLRMSASTVGLEGGTKLVRDTRWVGNAQSVGDGTISTRGFTDDTQLAIFGNLVWTGRQDLGNRQAVYDDGPIVLGLNQGLHVFSATANMGFTAHFQIRERTALPDETPQS